MGIPTVRDTQNINPASDDKTGENEVIREITLAIYLSANPNALLTCLTLLDFSGQDFILKTVMRSDSANRLS